MDTLLQDLRIATRSLFRNPGFTIVALLALALGIGAVSTVFSVVYGVLYRDLPYQDADRVAMVYMRFSPQNNERGNMSVADFLDWRAGNTAFENPAAYVNDRLNITGNGEAEQVAGAIVTPGFFPALRVSPLVGRVFEPGEDRPGIQVAVLSERLWRRRFGASPAAIGQPIVVNGAPCTIVGIMPAGFGFPRADTELWVNLELPPPTRRGPFFLKGLARLAPGVTFDQAQREMNALGRRIEASHPDAYSNLTLPVVPLRDSIVGNVRTALLVILGAVVCLLLIATLNVANLFLARAAARERETIVRFSLGATRLRVVRQLLTEGVVLSLAGGALGVALAYGGARLLHLWNPGNLPRIDDVQVDARVVAFTCAVSIVCGIVFGLAPALRRNRRDLSPSLRDGGRGGTGSASRRRVQAALVVCELSLSLILLTGAGLLVRSFVSLQQVALGFQAAPDSILTMQISPPETRYEERQSIVLFYERLLDRVRQVAGIEHAALSDSLPPNRQADSDTFQIEGEPLRDGQLHPSVTVAQTSAGYFRAMGLPVLKGRSFTERDTATSPRVTIISNSFARRFFAGQEPIGRRIKQSGPNLTTLPYMEIVGVVADTKYEGLDRHSDAAYYMPSTQSPARRTYLIVRSALSAGTLAPALRREIASIDPDVVVTGISTMEQAMSDSVAQPRFRTAALGLFATLALLLAAIGVYGVLSYSVTQRYEEFGVRMALGANRADVLRVVLRDGARVAAIAVAIGIPGAFLLTGMLSSLLFATSATDGLTFAGVSLILILVAFAASLVPALRATRVDPLVALRSE
jgi:putative ABC transport system permease protein